MNHERDTIAACSQSVRYPFTSDVSDPTWLRGLGSISSAKLVPADTCTKERIGGFASPTSLQRNRNA